MEDVIWVAPLSEPGLSLTDDPEDHQHTGDEEGDHRDHLDQRQPELPLTEALADSAFRPVSRARKTAAQIQPGTPGSQKFMTIPAATSSAATVMAQLNQ